MRFCTAALFLSCALVHAQTPNVVVWGDPAHTNVPPSATNVIDVAVGGTFNMALRDDGRIVFWGPQASYPQLNVTNAVAIGAERNRAHALLADGTVRSWDMAASGQELPVPDSVTNVVQIAAGITHCLALRADGQVVEWGGIPTGSSRASRKFGHQCFRIFKLVGVRRFRCPLVPGFEEAPRLMTLWASRRTVS